MNSVPNLLQVFKINNKFLLFIVSVIDCMHIVKINDPKILFLMFSSFKSDALVLVRTAFKKNTNCMKILLGAGSNFFVCNIISFCECQIFRLFTINL